MYVPMYIVCMTTYVVYAGMYVLLYVVHMYLKLRKVVIEGMQILRVEISNGLCTVVGSIGSDLNNYRNEYQRLSKIDQL